MAWIPNVNPNELVESAWGNTIRDHVVNTFASTAERAAAIPSPTIGMTTFIEASGRLETWRTPAGGGTPLWRPPVGTVIKTQSFNLPNLSVSGGGLYDVLAIDQTTTFPFDTLTLATTDFYAGFGGQPATFWADLFSFGLNAPTVQSPAPLSAPAGIWVPAPLSVVWGNAAGASVGYKVRLNFTGGANLHNGGSATIQVVVHL